MKIRYLTLALLVHALSLSAQRDSLYKKQRLPKTDIQAFFGFYVQNGNHSAITGGVGTEALKVYSPQMTLTHGRDSGNSYTFNGGVDVISSCSMDHIDHVLSSPSKVSSRIYLMPSYKLHAGRRQTYLTVNSGFSTESAYQSLPVGISIDHTSPSRATQWSAGLQCNFDDLRWRLIKNYGRPIGLVYPVELRDTNWFSIYQRRSYNFDLAWNRVINRRMQMAIYPELVYQDGLLCTPYHRVYFDDSAHTERVENLPRERWKVPIAVEWNTFVGGRTIIRAYYRWYWDDWGIEASSIQLETAIKLNPTFSLTPLLRFHTQTGARYFRPYAQHELTETYYTSDYDLSHFKAYKAGLTLRYAPHRLLKRGYRFNSVSLRYDFYKRSDGLSADILSLLIELGH